MFKSQDIKPIIVQTYQFRYLPLDDRIRMVVNYEDTLNRIDFTFTRKMIIEMIPAIDKHLIQYYSNISKEVQELFEKRGIDTSTKQKVPTGQNAPTKKTDLKKLEQEKKELVLIKNIGLSFLEDINISRITFYSVDEHIIAVGLLDGEGLKKVTQTIIHNTPLFWI